MSKPKTIFKYQDLSNHSLINLKKHALYMASPVQFNDPYDCALSYELNDYNDVEIENIKKILIEGEESEQKRLILKNLTHEEFRNALKKGAFTAINTLKENFLNKYGVCCFSEINTNLLMWAHYCNGCRGFCLEFLTEYEPFNKFYKVNYVSSFPKIDFLTNLFTNNASVLIELFCTKSKIWEYEKEWRVIHTQAGTEYHYAPECLKAIYFGPKIDENYKEIICLILQGQNPTVELWDGSLSDDGFNIQFKQFNYFSYIQAKELGLLE